MKSQRRIESLATQTGFSASRDSPRPHRSATNAPIAIGTENKRNALTIGRTPGVIQLRSGKSSVSQSGLSAPPAPGGSKERTIDSFWRMAPADPIAQVLSELITRAKKQTRG